MKVREALGRIKGITYQSDGPPVAATAAEALRVGLGVEARPAAKSATDARPATASGPGTATDPGPETGPGPATDPGRETGPGIFHLAVEPAGGKDRDPQIRLQIKADGSGEIRASQPYLLYSFIHHLMDRLSRLGDRDLEAFEKGRTITPAFKWQRISYDYFLTQEGRIQRNLDRESYVGEMARTGVTHLEVNGLAFPMALEKGPKGETYPMFYTYCPALDQFVYSGLNEGLYPYYYLSANLDNLKRNAALARKYGLTPGLLCFEPRSVPEQFFARYPMLRGARVDHPFRSFKPRYNMTITHPKVRDHYAEMMGKLMAEVPELGYLCVWTNDSGAGFEHTKSLYVGRNGGAYLIREWNDDEEIARCAGENALRFFRVLRDAAREVNPAFRVLTRMESFYGEHDTIWEGLEDGVEVETFSLAARGWEMPYTHPRYPDSHAINAGTVYHDRFDDEESSRLKELGRQGADAHFCFSAGPHILFEPLIGIPYPFLAWNKLKTMRDGGVEYLAHAGGLCPPGLAPYNINHEVMGAFAFDPDLDVDELVREKALAWAGEAAGPELVKAWKLAEEAILAFPNVTPLYSAFGFTWYRLWVRPLVPNLEAVPREDRAYYEAFMCTTPHNTNNVDLSRDVLFQLTTAEHCGLAMERMDRHLWKPLDEALEILRGLAGGDAAGGSAVTEGAAMGEDAASGVAANGEDPASVIHDQLVRLEALKCWFRTQHSVAAWIVGVHGYMAADGAEEKERCRVLLKEMMEREIENTRTLQDLLDRGVEFMASTDMGETPLVHGSNLKGLLDRRIALMKRHGGDKPFIDPDYVERKAGEN